MKRYRVYKMISLNGSFNKKICKPILGIVYFRLTMATEFEVLFPNYPQILETIDAQECLQNRLHSSQHVNVTVHTKLANLLYFYVLVKNTLTANRASRHFSNQSQVPLDRNLLVQSSAVQKVSSVQKQRLTEKYASSGADLASLQSNQVKRTPQDSINELIF